MTANGLGRIVKDADLKKYAMLAKKFTEGMLAKVPDTKITVADCLEEFASGSLGHIHVCLLAMGGAGLTGAEQK